VLQKWAIIVTIPVEEENPDAVICWRVLLVRTALFAGWRL